jgi:hypothetical protein
VCKIFVPVFIIEPVNLLFCSADKSHLKRKLDMDPEFGYGE